MKQSTPDGFHANRLLASEGAAGLSRRGLLPVLAIMALAGCSGGNPGSSVYLGDDWDDPFDDDDWIYYYEDDDEDFLAGLTDEQKDELQQRWDALPDEEKQQIREQWDQLSVQERTQVRQAWEKLDASQRQGIISSMEGRIQSGRLQPVIPPQAGPSRFQARHDPSFSRSPRTGTGRAYGGRGRGGRGGGRGGRR